MPKEFDPAVTAYVRANLPARLAPTLTLKQQAAVIGISDAHLANVLHGDANVGKKTLPIFARALGLTVDTLRREAHEAFGKSSRATKTHEPPIDTFLMAELAARDVTELDNVRPDAAWLLMRGVRPAELTQQGFYKEARKKLLTRRERSAPGASTSLGVKTQSSASSKAQDLFERPNQRRRGEGGRAKK